MTTQLAAVPVTAVDASPAPTPAAASPAPTGTATPTTLGPAAIAAELAKLGTSSKGLSPDEAKGRLEKVGPNAIVAKEESRWTKLIGYFWGPIPWMIEAAAIISLARLDWPDFSVVTGLLLYNAAVGFWQDNKAANALAALKKGLALKARVLRGGQWLSVDSADFLSLTLAKRLIRFWSAEQTAWERS